MGDDSANDAARDDSQMADKPDGGISRRAALLRIPTQSGRGFRFDVGRRSDLIPATIPK